MVHSKFSVWDTTKLTIAWCRRSPVWFWLIRLQIFVSKRPVQFAVVLHTIGEAEPSI